MTFQSVRVFYVKHLKAAFYPATAGAPRRRRRCCCYQPPPAALFRPTELWVYRGRNRRGETRQRADWTGGGVRRWGGRRKGRGGKRGKADTTETGGGRRVIYALKVAVQQTEELRRRGLRQDDNAVLPREFLGRCCFSLAVFTPVLFLIILLLCSLPIMFMSASKSAINHVAEVAVWFVGELSLVGGVR